MALLKNNTIERRENPGFFLFIWDKTQAAKNSRITKTQAKNCQNSSKIFPKLRFAGMIQE